MYRRSYDLIAVVVVALAALLWALVGLNSPVPRMALGMALVLVLPGYALTAALFPKRNIGSAERLLLIVGLSLAVAALGTFVLNLMPWGLWASSWAVLLSSTALAASAVAFIRRRRVGVGVPYKIRVPISLREGLMFGLAALVVILAVSEARSGAMQQPAGGFTELWTLPVNAPDTTAIRLGVKNMETTLTRYRLEVTVNGQSVREWPSIVLETGGQWETTLTFPTVLSGRVDVLLYRTDAPNVVYRRSVLWPGEANAAIQGERAGQ